MKRHNALQKYWEDNQTFLEKFRNIFTGVRSSQVHALLGFLYAPVKVRFRKTDPKAVTPSYANKGDAGMDLTAISRTYNKEYGFIEYDTGIAMEIPEGYVGLVFPRSSISKYKMTLLNSVGIIDSHFRDSIKFRMGSTENMSNIDIPVFTELDSTEYFEEWLLDEVRENTPHGECGVSEFTHYFKVKNIFYKVTIHNISWNRYDKQYYFIDMYEDGKLTITEIEETSLPTNTNPHIYKVGDRVGQLLIIPYPEIQFEEVDTLSITQRGAGFGSSGK